MAKKNETNFTSLGPRIWNTVEPTILIVLILVQLSTVLALLASGRKEKSFRQAFYIFFTSLTVIDCFLVVSVRATYLAAPIR